MVTSKTALRLLSSDVKIKVGLQRKDSGIVLKFSPQFLKGRIDNTAKKF